MGLFDKKFCDICGEKIGLLGNRKLEDGNMCKDCAKLLSPFFSDRRSSTLQEIKQQLAYREQNRIQLRSITPDRVFGEDKKFFIDSSKGAFVISRRGQNNWDEENPDIIPIASVNSCNLRIEQTEDEQYYENANGESVSYNPPRYLYSYTFVLELNVNNPYFDDIEITLNNSEVEAGTQEYMLLQQNALNIMSAIAPGKFTMPNTTGVTQQAYGYSQPTGNMYQQPTAYYNQPMGNMYQQQTNPYQQPVMNTMQQPGYQQQPIPPYTQPQNPYVNQMPPQNIGQQQYQQNAAPFAQNANMYNQQSAPLYGWICPCCGTSNTSNFCSNCGTKKA